MKQIAMYKKTENGETEIFCLPGAVERMESIGWSKDKPKKQREKPEEKPAE